MKINVIGLGYIGLPTALMLATHGSDVVGTDINQTLVDKLNHREISFHEEGIDRLFHQAIEKGILFSTEYQQADMYIVAVPTPYIKKDKKIDASYVSDACKRVYEVCPEGAIIVVESTISPGTTDKFIRPILTSGGFDCKKINLVHAPERIIPGRIVSELINNPRIIGTDCREIGEEVKNIYQTFCQSEIAITDIRTAEMTKVVENTYRDVNIAFANELAKICNSDDINVYEVIKMANMHPRVNILAPGPGVGGHCISVDPWFLVGDYPGLANIILAARKINDSMPEYVLQRVSDIMKKQGISDVSKVGLYGLTYKEDVDDLRESPTLQLLDNMNRHLAGGVKIYDPCVTENRVDNQYQDFDAFVEDTEFIVIMVGHTHIKKNMERLKGKIVLDTKNICALSGVYKL